jgi:hypothetical protein
MLTRMSSARELATRAHEMGALILRGQLVRHDSDWAVDGRSVGEWLAEFEGRQVYLIAVASDAKSAPASVKRTCRTCGRDYEGDECPYCREARIRLRGR